MLIMEAWGLPVSAKLPESMKEREFAGCNLNPVVVLTDCRKLLKGKTSGACRTSPVGGQERQESRNGSISRGEDSEAWLRGPVRVKGDVSRTPTPIRSSPSPSCRTFKSVKRKRDSEESREYEIENIVGYHRDKKGKMWYFIKWKGWSDEYNTFEPIDNLTGCHYKLMEYFEMKNPSRADLKKKELELMEAVSKRSIYERLKNKACTGEDIEEFSREFPQQLRELFQTKDLDNLERGVEEQYGYIIRSLIGMCLHQDPGLVLRAQNFKLFLMLIQQRRKQLENLSKFEKIINDREKTHVGIVNEVDLEEFPDLEYIVDMKPGEGVVVPDEPLLGCECEECKPKSRCCGKMGDSVFAYTPEGKLRTPSRVAIYECNSRCRCSEECPNRVVQRGRQVDLTIFKTESCGWGVRAEEVIPKGAFVCEYVGELIPDSEANARDVGYFKERKSGYMFDLDFFTDSCVEMYCIDATKRGNLARFINHSCDPNLVVYPVWVDCLAPNMHRLAFFARRRIRKGEEIHFDYENLEDTSREEREDNGNCFALRMLSNVRCRCKSPNCRKWVFGNK